MNAFENIIGYESVKEELLQVADIIKNREKYEKLGAKVPHGLLIYGAPGLGKTTLAEEFIKECGVHARIIKKNNIGEDIFRELEQAFSDAKEKAQAIVLLDDMDKYANEDDYHADAEVYLTIQNWIDAVRDDDVFVIATVNDIWKLPKSLKRAGRFDRIIKIEKPEEDDELKIVEHYLKSKAIDNNINVEDIVKMSGGASCAELETILNEAAIYAAYEECEHIEIRHVMDAVLKIQHKVSRRANLVKSDEDFKKTALHEAGHLVMAEVIKEGIVGLASMRASSFYGSGGFVKVNRRGMRRPEIALLALAGKAAVELYYADQEANGCMSDLNEAAMFLRSGMIDNASVGLSMLNTTTPESCETSNEYAVRVEVAVNVEMERLMRVARRVMIDNRGFLEKVRDALVEKDTLLSSDIKLLRNEFEIKGIEI